MYLITKWFGTFIIDKNEIKNKILFPKDKNKISSILLKLENGEILAEEKKNY